MHTHTHTRTRTHTRAHTHAHTHAHKHKKTRTHARTHMHTHLDMRGEVSAFCKHDALCVKTPALRLLCVCVRERESE